MTTNKLKIQVIGECKVGKTAIAHVIEKALFDNGIHCEITGSEDDDPIILKEQLPERIKNTARLYKDTAINIETIRTVYPELPSMYEGRN